MTDNKRKLGETSPEENIKSAKNNKSTPNIFKHAKMSISPADFQKIKAIIDSSLHTELALATANLATKEDLNKLNTEINFLRKQNEDLAEKVQRFEERCNLLEQELESQSRELKGSNIIISIPNEDARENPEEKIRSVSQLLLGSNCTRDISPPTKIGANNTATKFKINAGSNEIALQMLKNAPKLRGTGVFLQGDLTKRMQQKQRILLQYRKIIKTNKPNTIIKIKKNALLIENKLFYLDNNNNLKFNENDGEYELQQMFLNINFEAVKNVSLSKGRQIRNVCNRSTTFNDAPGMPLQQVNSSMFRN